MVNNLVKKHDFNRSSIHKDKKNDYDRKNNKMTIERVQDYVQIFDEIEASDLTEEQINFLIDKNNSEE